MICRRNNYIFIRIPKTGSTSVYRALGGEAADDSPHGFSKELLIPLEHMTASELLKFGFVSQTDFQSFFKFCFVRNPWDLVVSEWKWRMNKYNFGRRSIYHYWRPSLKNFLRKSSSWRGEMGHKIRRHLLPQYYYIHDRNDNLLVDYVGRFETIYTDFAKVCDQLNTSKCILPHARGSERKSDYRTYYDEESYELVKQMYQVDIEYFDYDFDRVEG